MRLLSLFFYRVFLCLYALGVRIAALWNPKARLWIAGRKAKLPAFGAPVIWMHCASLGEFEQGRPVLEGVKQRFRGYNILLTFFSPSGYEIRKNYTGADAVLYLPLDGKKSAADFIEKINPALVLWVKYEYWYYYLTEIHRRNIPLLLVSGKFRASQPFFKSHGAMWRKMLEGFSHLFVQDKNSAKLLQTILPEEKFSVTGDTRFDRVMQISQQFEPLPIIEKFTHNYRVLVAGSTWEEDEAALAHYAKQHTEMRFIIAPHEVDEANIRNMKKFFPEATLFSELDNTATPSHILIINNIGMLSRLYHYADVAYVGGGFRESGIHNTLEAAVYGKPVIFGPVHEKFNEAVELIQAGGAFSIPNAPELEAMLDRLFRNESFWKKAAESAAEYVATHTGATKKIVGYIYANRLLTS